MRLARFRDGSRARWGVVEDSRVIDLSDAGIAADLDEVLAGGVESLDEVRAAAGRAPGSVALDGVHLLAPTVRPGKMVYVGRNYGDHAKEAKLDLLPYPSTFVKLAASIAGPGDAVVLPSMSAEVDYEAELAVVIGRTCRDVAAADALDHVAGYLVANDVSARDIQLKDRQLSLAKNFRTFAPLGPWIVSADEVPDPQSLRLRLWLNGDLMQDGTTADMNFPVAEIIAFLSTVTDLNPGDVISTGTPSGVGMSRTPPVWLQNGDRMRVEIDGIGVLENHVVAARVPTATA